MLPLKKGDKPVRLATCFPKAKRRSHCTHYSIIVQWYSSTVVHNLNDRFLYTAMVHHTPTLQGRTVDPKAIPPPLPVPKISTAPRLLCVCRIQQFEPSHPLRTTMVFQSLATTDSTDPTRTRARDHHKSKQQPPMCDIDVGPQFESSCSPHREESPKPTTQDSACSRPHEYRYIQPLTPQPTPTNPSPNTTHHVPVQYEPSLYV